MHLDGFSLQNLLLGIINLEIPFKPKLAKNNFGMEIVASSGVGASFSQEYEGEEVTGLQQDLIFRRESF